MFPYATLLSSLLIVASVANATPIQRDANTFTLSLAAKINSLGSSTLTQIDRARVAALLENALAKANGKRAGKPDRLTDTFVSYTASVGVGSPPTQYTLLIDSGSSNTFVGTGKAYVKTSTSSDTGNTASVSYGSGSWSGEEYIDEVTLSPSLVIKKQSIGVASKSQGFSTVDGILGIGPVDLTEGTEKNVATVPTVVDNLFSAGTIAARVVGAFFKPSTELAFLDAGELSFGGPDRFKTFGPITYVPITSQSPANLFWGIDQSVKYGTTTILSSTAGIVDTGTTLILLATDAFNAYQKATGGVLDPVTTLLKITSQQYRALKPLNFIVGGRTFSLPPNGQIWPRALNSQIGGTSGEIYLIVADLGTPSGQGLDFINGFTFLQRFYSVFDTDKSQVGLAHTLFTDLPIN